MVLIKKVLNHIVKINIKSSLYILKVILFLKFGSIEIKVKMY